MSTAIAPNGGVWRHSPADAILVVLSFVHGAMLLAAPPFPVVAAGLWWNANTISHNFIHLPFFGREGWNRAYSAYLSLVLGFPQSVWRDRHLAHHADARVRMADVHQTLLEVVLIGWLWAVLIAMAPRFFVMAYLPGCALGLALCFIHGYFEHFPRTSSHYSSLYNIAFFNDGYHVEHHRRPEQHWTLLPATPAGQAGNRWPAVLRWLDLLAMDRLTLEWLERVVVLRSVSVRRFVLGRHEQALRKLVPRIHAGLDTVSTIAIVGGGLYPRTALICRRVFPSARIVIIDASVENMRRAQRFLDPADASIEYIHRKFEPGRMETSADIVVVPLALIGDRRGFYSAPTAPVVLVHDWVWNRAGSGGAVVSFLLFKRLNLVESERRFEGGAK